MYDIYIYIYIYIEREREREREREKENIILIICQVCNYLNIYIKKKKKSPRRILNRIQLFKKYNLYLISNENTCKFQCIFSNLVVYRIQISYFIASRS